MASRTRHACPNPHCGNNLWHMGYEYVAGVFSRVWKCNNCSFFEAVKAHPRRTLARIAFDNYAAVRTEWAAIDAALDRLTAKTNPNRIPNGALFAHCSAFNYHLDKLRDGKLNTWEVKYHTGEARSDMSRARNFVAEKGGFNERV